MLTRSRLKKGVGTLEAFNPEIRSKQKNTSLLGEGYNRIGLKRTFSQVEMSSPKEGMRDENTFKFDK